MPRGFTGQLSERLNRLSQLRVKEAEDLDPIKPGYVLICPGGYHLGVRRKGAKNVVVLKEGKLTDKYIPSVDYMMKSAAEVFGANAMGVVLTGMGNDGKQGVVEIKTKGGYTIAESEASAVVFGMPAEAIKTGAVESTLPVSEIAAEILRVTSYTVNREKA
jgi:two-component system chemotaxis response regulator CheB